MDALIRRKNKPGRKVDSFEVTISSSEGLLFSGEAAAVEIHSPNLTCLALPDQSTFYTLAEPSRILIRAAGRESTFTLSGVMSIRGRRIQILSETPHHETHP